MAVDLSLTPGQLGEIWQAATVEEGIALLRHISAGDAADDAEAGGPPAPADEILLEFLYGALAFCKEQGLAAPKALAFLAVMQQTHALATSDLALTREDVLAGFAEKFLAATKALPAADRFALAEVQLLTQRARETLVRHLKLFQLVATQSQTLRESFAELFVQVPAKPPPLASFAEGDGAAAAPAEPEAPPAEAPPAAAAPAAAPPAEGGYDEAAAAAPSAAAAAPAAAPPADGGLADKELADAIGRAVAAQVSALQASMAAEYEAKEAALLERIAKLAK